MKRLILYVMMMSIAIAINSCEKETLEPDELTGTISFDGLFRTIDFTVSLDKTRYMVGETATAKVSVSDNYCDGGFFFNGKITIAGKEYLIFREEVVQKCDGTPWFLDNIPIETTHGDYNATFTVTKFTYFAMFTITNTQKVQISYEVR